MFAYRVVGPPIVIARTGEKGFYFEVGHVLQNRVPLEGCRFLPWIIHLYEVKNRVRAR